MSLTSAIASLGSTSWLRTTRKQPCPICGRSGWCELSRDGTLAHCMRSTSGGRPIGSRGGGRLFELRTSASSNFPPQNRGGIALFYSQVRPGHSERAANQAGSEEQDRLGPVQLDVIFRALLERCPLSERHRRYLEKAGVPLRAELGTLWANRAHQLGWQLVRHFGEEMASRHPLLLHKTFANSQLGLIHQAGDPKRKPTISCHPVPPRLSYWTLAGAGDGLLFGATNYQGLITGMQIRYDWPRDPSQRYRWLSSQGKGGTPLAVFKATVPKITARSIPGEGLSDILVITEGYKKAAALNYAWGNPTISLAGVSAYQPEELVNTVVALGSTHIAVAFDQDKRANLAVRQAEARLLGLLATNFPEINLYLLEWEGSVGKGLDDALQAGLPLSWVRVTTLPAQTQAPNVQSLMPEESLSSRNPGEFKPSNSKEILAEADWQAQWETLRQAERVSQRYSQARQK